MDAEDRNIWTKAVPAEEWLEMQDTSSWTTTFHKNGYLKISDILNDEEVAAYRRIYDSFLCGRIDASTHRQDLGSHITQKTKDSENICQIMWPSKFCRYLQEGPFHQRAMLCAKNILGEDMEFDFDMMISKAPFTNTVMPWHQDESYWPDLPDKRAISFWLSLDHATIENGCMQFIPGSHKCPLRDHFPVKKGHHTLTCTATEEEFSAIPLSPGSCTLHHGRTVHYTRGNSTCTNRRALIVNTRPRKMVSMERELEFDHGKEGGVSSVVGEGQGHKANS